MELPWISARAADVVDTTGAGDAFAAAFLAARLRGEGIQDSLTAAVAAGSAATEFIGGRPVCVAWDLVGRRLASMAADADRAVA